jgi:hypothetical protein
MLARDLFVYREASCRINGGRIGYRAKPSHALSASVAVFT